MMESEILIQTDQIPRTQWFFSRRLQWETGKAAPNKSEAACFVSDVDLN